MNGDIGQLSLWLFVGLVALAVIMVPLIVFVWLKDRSKRHYDHDRNQIHLSEMRNTYEREIAELSRRLTATEERWEEVNHLILRRAEDAQAAVTSIIPPDVPLLREMQIAEHDIELEPDLIFVLTPFSDDEASTYSAIQYACMELGLRCMRGDEEFIDGDVLPHVVRLIARARLVIANVGARNANVFYELGIAHTLGKQTILVGRTIEEVPFDVRMKRVVLFSSVGQLSTKLKNTLRQALNLSA